VGHERVGWVPKTKKWRDLIAQIGLAYGGRADIEDVAAQTLKNVQAQYQNLSRDEAVKSAYAYLLRFALACGKTDINSALQGIGIANPETASILAVVRNLRTSVPVEQARTEYGDLAINAAADALGTWQRDFSSKQIDLFNPSGQSLESWRDLGTGSGFCQLSRVFFGKLTERYLKYFLDRVASSECNSLEGREQFQRGIEKHVDDISKHAFETAQITQSFAAGWFNKHRKNARVTETQLEGYLGVAFGKLREELRIEGAKK